MYFNTDYHHYNYDNNQTANNCKYFFHGPSPLRATLADQSREQHENGQ